MAVGVESIQGLQPRRVCCVTTVKVGMNCVNGIIVRLSLAVDKV